MAATPPFPQLLGEIQRVLTLEGQALLHCAGRLQSSENADQMARCLDLLNSSLERGGKIVVTGVGKSGKVAQKIAATLSSTGSLAVYLHPTEGLHGDLGIITSKDCILALSHTGNTDELLQLLPSLKRLSVPLIGLGGNARSQLAQACDAWIDASIEQEACPHNLAPTTSTTLALALGDALAVALMKIRGFDLQAFAKNHPGGALGRRMNLTVQEVMHHGSELPLLSADASPEAVIEVSTLKKLGIVLITQPDLTLLGIITDGDIRRALKRGPSFFSLKARDFMTERPTTILANSMAADALALMENRPSQISVLPVVSSDGRAVGVVRLHDLVKTL